MSAYLSKFESLCKDIMRFEQCLLPLCAAENVMSPFAKIPLDTSLQEKYIMGGVQGLETNSNFTEAKYLFPFYDLIKEQCQDLFHCAYADPRALSGVNAVMLLLMSLFDEGDTLLISSEDSGGHSSMPLICKRLGISTIEMPYNYDKMDFDYDVLNQILAKGNINGILICPSDLLWQPHLENVCLPQSCILIYDATQTLGLIGGRANRNPLDYFTDTDNVILMGATHKTIPGPTCGLIMTKNLELACQFDATINPDYLRNVQFHHILSLSLALMEIETFGESYGRNIINNANYLGCCLEDIGIEVIQKENGVYTETHQLFLPIPPDEVNNFANRCDSCGLSLNVRNKRLYRGSGVRLGLQEVTRYGWQETEMKQIADILFKIKNAKDLTCLLKSIQLLAKNKSIQYSFDKKTIDRIYASLHNC